MKKLLFQLDTTSHPSVFDTVVAYDGGADHVIGHAGVTPANVAPLIEGAIFTRAPKEKKNTALFVGGDDLSAGEAVLSAAQKVFFPGFQVSIMLDSNGSNTTAAAAIAKLQQSGTLRGKNAVILAGTGPVGQRAAVILAKEGANVSITSRRLSAAQGLCKRLYEQFFVEISACPGEDEDARKAAVEDAHIVFSCGAGGIELLPEQHWRDHPTLELIADANATPPLGIGGIDMMDAGKVRYGKTIWGAIGFGSFKLALHRACIAKLFERNDLALDIAEIFTLAKKMN